ncbi:MAG: type II toxin-antitoxin system RelE/ParE family toxin [Planctomycetota bacterium]
MTLVSIRPEAAAQIDEQTAYLYREAGLEIALRFIEALDTTIAGLVKFPEKGSLQHFNSPSLQSVRATPILGFENWRIYYLSRQGLPTRIEILHILHASQDRASILNDN